MILVQKTTVRRPSPSVLPAPHTFILDSDQRPANVSFRAQPRNLGRSKRNTSVPAARIAGFPRPFAMKIARRQPPSSCRGNPVPMVGRRGEPARHLQLPTERQRPAFIISCSLCKAIVTLCVYALRVRCLQGKVGSCQPRRRKDSPWTWNHPFTVG